MGSVVRLAGRLDADQLVELYRRAWVLVSTSAREGWGMTVTEAAACGTPSVVSRIAGHLDAVDDGVTGLLFDNEDQFVKSVDRVLADCTFRSGLSKAAHECRPQILLGGDRPRDLRGPGGRSAAQAPALAPFSHRASPHELHKSVGRDGKKRDEGGHVRAREIPGQ